MRFGMRRRWFFRLRLTIFQCLIGCIKGFFVGIDLLLSLSKLCPILSTDTHSIDPARKAQSSRNNAGPTHYWIFGPPYRYAYARDSCTNRYSRHDHVVIGMCTCIFCIVHIIFIFVSRLIRGGLFFLTTRRPISKLIKIVYRRVIHHFIQIYSVVFSHWIPI